MRVQFSAAAVADDSAWTHLDQMIYEIERGAHEWHVDDPDAIEHSQWLQNHPQSLRTLFEKAAMLPTPRQPRRLHRMLLIVGDDAPPTSLSPAKAVQFLRTSFTVLMENRFTDGVFLDAVLLTLADPDVMRFKEELEVLKYDSPGGTGELKKLVEDVYAKAQRRGVPVRSVVFTDSDGRRSGQKSDQAREVEEVCKRLGVPCVVLRKRSIENYVPDEVIREWRNELEQVKARPRIDAFLRLTGEQRDHFPVKKGFNAQPKPLSRDEHDLYLSGRPQPAISAADQTLLERGFGGNFVHIFFLKKPDGDFERHGNGIMRARASLTAQALRNRDGCGELDQLVTYIEEQL